MALKKSLSRSMSNDYDLFLADTVFHISSGLLTDQMYWPTNSMGR